MISIARDVSIDIQEDIANAIGNVFENGNASQIDYLINQNVALFFNDLLFCSNPDLIMIAINNSQYILEKRIQHFRNNMKLLSKNPNEAIRNEVSFSLSVLD